MPFLSSYSVLTINLDTCRFDIILKSSFKNSSCSKSHLLKHYIVIKLILLFSQRKLINKHRIHNIHTALHRKKSVQKQWKQDFYKSTLIFQHWTILFWKGYSFPNIVYKTWFQIRERWLLNSKEELIVWIVIRNHTERHSNSNSITH